jgi:hypothetical protein
VHNTVFRSFTLLENLAAGVAFCINLWFCSFPKSISSTQLSAMRSMSQVFVITLLTAWICGIISLIYLWMGKERETSGFILRERWGILSMIVTLLVTAMCAMIPKLHSVGL